MRSFAAVVVAFFVVSCTAYPSDKAVTDGLYEETGDEFDMVESLRENPLDPRRAEIEDLLSIPGFPAGLAKRIIEVTREESGRRGWLNRLTPPERHTLYMYKEFLVLPAGRSTRISSWVLENGLGSRISERTDGFFSVMGDGWKLFGRGRSSYGSRAASLNICRSIFSGAINLHVGDFVPDFAMGLIFSGYSRSYPFSGGYPFRVCRWIVQRTSFYGTSLRGYAGEAWKGPVRAVLFAGSPRLYRSGGIEIDDSRVWGVRAGIRLRGGEAGATFSGDTSYGAGRLFAVDGMWRREHVLTGGELAFRGRGRVAGAWGLSFRGGVFDAGILAYSMPSGFGTAFGGLPGGTGLFRRGFSVVIRRCIHRRIEVRSAFERTISRNGFETEDREVARVEAVKKWKGASLKLSWQLKRYGGFESIPYPGGDLPSVSKVYNLNVLLTWRFSNGFRMRASIRCPRGGTDSGCLAAPSLSFPLFSNSISVTIAAVGYRSMSGTPVFYFYEPSFRGGYPWRSARGSGWRGIFIVEATARWFGFLGKVSAVSDGGPEAGLQLSFNL